MLKVKMWTIPRNGEIKMAEKRRWGFWGVNERIIVHRMKRKLDGYD